MHWECLQAYTFDVQGASRPPEMRYCATRPNFSALEAAARNNDAGGITGPPGAPNAAVLDEKASEMRTEANQAVMQVRLCRCCRYRSSRTANFCSSWV